MAPVKVNLILQIASAAVSAIVNSYNANTQYKLGNVVDAEACIRSSKGHLKIMHELIDSAMIN